MRRAAANRARDLDEEKRKRDVENQRLARQRNPMRRAAAHRARDIDEEKRRRDTENKRLTRQRRAAANRASYQEGLMFTFS